MSVTAQEPGQPRGWVAFQGKLPGYMILAFVLQLVAVIWQAGQVSEQVAEHAARLTRLEAAREAADRDSAARNERLAGILGRLETAVDGLRITVERMQAQQNGTR